MSNCNLCWLFITTSFTKKQTNRNRSASLHLLFAQPVPFPPGFSELWLQNGKGEGWACLSVSCCCTSPVQHGDEPHWISSTSCPPPLCHILKHCPDSSSQGVQTELTKSEDPVNGNPQHWVCSEVTRSQHWSLAPNPPNCVCWAKIHSNLSHFKILQKYFKN